MTSTPRLFATFAAAVLSVVSGCAGKQLSFGNSLFRKGDVETVSTEPASGVEQVAAAQQNATEERTVEKSPFLPPPNSGQLANASANGGQQPVAMHSAVEEQLRAHLDAATFALVEEEFRGVSVEHRHDWYKMLLTVNAEKVPQMVQAHHYMMSPPMTPPSMPMGETTVAAGPTPSQFMSQPPAGPAVATVVQPGVAPSPVPQQYSPAVTPGQVVPRPMVNHEVAPAASGTVAAAYPQATAHPLATAAATQMVPPGTGEQQAVPQAAWPPTSAPTPPVRQTGFLEMPQAQPAAVQTVAATAAPAPDGKYALSNDWDTQLRRLIDMIEQEIAKPSATASSVDDEKSRLAELHVYLRMLYLMDSQETRSMQAIPDIPPTHQEFWTQMFWGMTNYFDREGIEDPSHRATETITQLRAAIERLKPESRLQLRNASFSHKINSFGDYEQFNRDEFDAGQPVLVYVEVQNFASEMGKDGLYKTRLRSSIEIHKAGRGPESGLMHSEDFPATEDTCRNLRQDYFHSYRIDLPNNLTPGPYILKLMVEDEVSQRISTTSLSFTVN